jgi:hypothetical protein
MGRNWLRILDTAPVKLPAGGGTARVRLGAPTSGFASRFDLELSDPPDGVSLQLVSPVANGAELVLKVDPAKAKAGQAGNLIVNIFPGRNAAAAQPGKKQPNQRRMVGTLPAIPFEMVQ